MFRKKNIFKAIDKLFDNPKKIIKAQNHFIYHENGMNKFNADVKLIIHKKRKRVALLKKLSKSHSKKIKRKIIFSEKKLTHRFLFNKIKKPSVVVPPSHQNRLYRIPV